MFTPSKFACFFSDSQPVCTHVQLISRVVFLSSSPVSSFIPSLSSSLMSSSCCTNLQEYDKWKKEFEEFMKEGRTAHLLKVPGAFFTVFSPLHITAHTHSLSRASQMPLERRFVEELGKGEVRQSLLAAVHRLRPPSKGVYLLDIERKRERETVCVRVCVSLENVLSF